jgi:DNA-binding NarL/FixJ family response regulator
MTQLFICDPELLDQLTPRENSVLVAAQKNQPISEIATTLQITDRLVLRHLKNIISKIGDSDYCLAYQILLSYELEDQT